MKDDMERRENNKVPNHSTFSKEVEEALSEDFASSGAESLDMTQRYLVALVRAFAGASSSWSDLIRRLNKAYEQETDDLKKTSLAVIRAKAEIMLCKEQEHFR
jgi:hypothetical protein